MEKSNETPNAVEQKVSGSLLGEGIVIAAIAVIAQCATYIYEASYCEYFRIPLSLIVINVTTVLFVFFAVLFASLLPICLAGLFRNLGISPIHPVGRRLRILSTPTIALYVYIAFIRPIGFELLLGPLLLAVFAANEFLLPLATQWRIRGYIAKLQAQDGVSLAPRAVLPTLVARFGLQVVQYGALLLHALMWTFLLAWMTGRSQGKLQEDYFIVDSEPSLVVLRIYGDHVVCAPLQKSTKDLDPTFTILSIVDPTNKSPLKLRLSRLGPLKIAAPAGRQ